MPTTERGRQHVIDNSWIANALAGARPHVVGALHRHFRNLDIAEEAFQEASLRALSRWTVQGPPRDRAAWLILAGQIFALDEAQWRSRQPDDIVAKLENPQVDLAERLDESHYHDDVFRLMFVCCHPNLPATQRIALALRVVSGWSVKEIARPFLVSESTMEQRITRALRRVTAANVSFETTDAVERSSRLAAVAATIHLLFNEGYCASGSDAHVRAPLCEEAIRLARLLLRHFQSEPESMGLLALLLLQHARAEARVDADGNIVLPEYQDRARWDRALMAEGFVLVEKALRHRQPGPYQLNAAITAVHMHAARAEDTDWTAISKLYQILETTQPSPVVSLNRAVAVSKVDGPAAALKMIEPLAERLEGYFHFFGVKGGLLLQLGRDEEARASLDRAIAFANTAAEAVHIRMHLDRLMPGANLAALALRRLGPNA